MAKRSSKLSKATTKDPSGLEITHLGDERIEVLKAVAELRAGNPCLAANIPIDFNRRVGWYKLRSELSRLQSVSYIGERNV